MTQEVLELLKRLGIDIDLSKIETVSSCPHGLKEKRLGNIVLCLQHNELWICFPLGAKKK